MIPDGLRNPHKADILIINTFPQQLDYSDTRKQQSLVFPLDPKSNLCFPMLRLGNRPRTSHTKQEYRSNVKQIHLSLHANRADPEQADVPGSTLLRLSWIWLTAHRSYSRALKKNQLSQLLPSRRGSEVKVTVYGALKSIKTSNPMLCHCHPSCLNRNSKLVSPGFLP